MSNFNCRVLGAVSCVALGFAAVDNANADIRVFGAAGYATTTNEDSSVENKEMTGYDVNLTGQLDVFSVGIASIYAGPSFKVSALSKDYTSNGVEITQALAATHGGIEAGVHVGAIIPLSVQAGLNYNIGLSAKGTVEGTGIPAAEVEGESGSEMGVTVRAMFTPFPLLRAGVEVSAGSGSAQFKGESSKEKYTYSSYRAVVGIAL